MSNVDRGDPDQTTKIIPNFFLFCNNLNLHFVLGTWFSFSAFVSFQ